MNAINKELLSTALNSTRPEFLFNHRLYRKKFVSRGSHFFFELTSDDFYLCQIAANDDGVMFFEGNGTICVPNEYICKEYTQEELFQLSTVLTQEQLKAIPLFNIVLEHIKNFS